MNKVTVAVAPVGPWGRGHHNPLTPAELGEEVENCAREGASLLHIHARDEAGDLVADMSVFNDAVQMVKSRCDIILEASTGGLSGLTAEERGRTLTNPHAEAGSLNLGSLNFGDKVYQNATPDILEWIKVMANQGVKPSLEIFDTGQIAFARHLIDEGVLTPPFNFSFIFDVRWGMQYSAGLLGTLRDSLPDDSMFGCIFAANTDFSRHLECVGLGASMVRVGFEDSPVHNGARADSNAQIVGGIVAALESKGSQVASVTEARQMLGTTRR